MFLDFLLEDFNMSCMDMDKQLLKNIQDWLIISMHQIMDVKFLQH